MWRRYRYEFLLLGAVVWALAGWWYKFSAFEAGWDAQKKAEQTISEVRHLVSLQSLWRNGKAPKKLKALALSSGADWEEKGKEIHVVLEKPLSRETDRLVTRLLRTPLVIKRFDMVHKGDTRYRLEWTCKK